MLGGGGLLGACEAGMLRALLERGIRPDLVVGTSIGAINGAAVAGEPTVEGAKRLCAMWDDVERTGVLGGSLFARVRTLVTTGTHLHAADPLRDLLDRNLPGRRIEELAVPFQCVAASIERASEHWFTSGPVVPAVLASSAVPGLLPPVEIDGEHFVDGGIVNSIPVGRALELGATRIFVLHVGRIERPLEAPRTPWEVALVSFELARRHRFFTDLAALPEGVDVQVLPTGVEEQPRYSSLANLRYRDMSRIGERIELAYRATVAHLAGTGQR